MKVSGPARRSGIAAGVLAVLAAGLLAAGGTGAIPPTGAFFGGGAALLVAGLLALQTALRRAMRRPVGSLPPLNPPVHGGKAEPAPTSPPASGGKMAPAPSPRAGRAGVGVPSLAALALRGAAASPGRSLLIAGLFACAAFVLIAVAANKRDASAEDVRRKDSGAGGFALRAVASLPIGYDFGSPEGRERLGFAPEDEALFQGVTVMPFLMSPGDDISCLNPTRPAAPRLLGVPAAMVERGGCRVVGPAGKETNPWEALRGEAPEGTVPAFGDADSVMWTLHSGAGKVYPVPTAGGQETDLFLAGLLPGSVFAGELLVSEERFRGLFPSVGGPRYFLIATPPGREEKVAEALRRNLGDLGLEVRATQEILTNLKGVQNTYLSAFLALGGLGLLLGTFGLVSAMLRSVLERRGELAMMLAMGFPPNALARLLVLENAGLLAVGMAWGVACALLAVAPTVSAAGARVPWAGLFGLLATMAALGLASCAVTARSAAGEELVAALREG